MFVRGGPTATLATFLCFFRGERMQILLKADHHRPTGETPFKTGVPMMAQH